MKNSVKKEKFYTGFIVNVALIVMLISVCLIGFGDQVSTVFSGGKELAIYRGNTSKKQVSLMINVYWGTEFLDGMLQTLKDEGVQVTFFIGGMWANENEKYVKQFTERGHELGNHGYYHKDHKELSEKRNEEEIYITHRLIKGQTGRDMTLFAPPSGSYNNLTLEVAKRLGYKTILWSRDTIDWRDKDTELIYNRATLKPKNGELILMHPTKNTAEALPRIIKFYKDNGYELVGVSKNITE